MAKHGAKMRKIKILNDIFTSSHDRIHTDSLNHDLWRPLQEYSLLNI